LFSPPHPANANAAAATRPSVSEADTASEAGTAREADSARRTVDRPKRKKRFVFIINSFAQSARGLSRIKPMYVHRARG
jgi:hypothetical protein